MSSKGTILIVEDQVGFRMIYEDLLVDAGYKVICAEDGEAGWNLAKEKKPSLVLLDLGLPKVDGFEVLRRMREDPKTKDIPVIIFSVMGEQANVKRAMDMGANDYTIKGFYTPRQILSKIKSQLILFEPMQDAAAYKIQVQAGGAGAAKFQEEIGLTHGYQCPHCNVEMVLEMFPDHIREGTHWFTSRLACPRCEKAV